MVEFPPFALQIAVFQPAPRFSRGHHPSAGSKFAFLQFAFEYLTHGKAKSNSRIRGDENDGNNRYICIHKPGARST